MPATPSSRSTWLTRERMVLAGLLAFALVVRGGVLWAMREKLGDDPDAYREIAENLLRHGRFALGEHELGAARDAVDAPPQTAYRPPLYPVVLSNLAAADRAHVSLAKVAGLHLLLGVGMVWLTWLTARRFQLCRVGQASETSADPRGAGAPPRGSAPSAGLTDPTAIAMPLVAGVVVACDPILLNQSALVMTETLAAFLAVLSLWCLARFDSQRSWFNAGLVGGAMGLAVLCRPTFLPWGGLVGIGMLLVRGRIANCKLQSWWADAGWRVANCAALVAAAGMVVSPWAIRNQRVFGKPIVTTTHGGYTLWLGNNEDFYAHLRSGRAKVPWRAPESNPFEGIHGWGEVGMSMTRLELEHDRDAYLAARWAIRENPAMAACASAYRIGQLWSPLPNRLTVEESAGRRLLRYAVAAWYCGVYFLVAVGIWRLRWKVIQPPWVWGVLLCLVFTGVHTFYWSNLRMRAPLMPFMACLAAAAVPGRQEKPRMDADRRG